jgi:acyl dehydratase
MARHFASLNDFKAAVGTELGSSEWIEISQERINLFADATGDHQWIHVDPEAASKGPFGMPIAHGYLTLSLLPGLLSELFTIDDLTMGLNYGANKLRFTAPVPVGSKVRATAMLKETKDIAIGTQAVLAFTVEIEGSDKPALLAEVVYVYAA